MKENEKKSKLKDKIISMLLFLIMGGGAGFLGGYAMGKLLPKGAPIWQVGIGLAILMLIFYGMITVHVFIHETGHMICGLISGYEFGSIRFFSLMFVKLDGKIRIKKHSVAGTGGQCLMTPPEIDGTSPVALYNWGGCLANVIAALIAMSLTFVFGDAETVKTLLFMFAIIGIGLAIINGIPMKSLSNDGYNAMTLKKRPNARRALEKSLFILKEMGDGKRLKEMPAEWFDYEIGKYELDDNLLITMAVMTLSYHVDSNDFDKAYELSKYLLENVTMVDVHKIAVAAELVHSILMTERDDAEIDKILTDDMKKLMKVFKAQPSMYRVWYAYELLHNSDEAKADENKKMFKKLAAKYPYQSDVESDRELMAKAYEKYIAKSK